MPGIYAIGDATGGWMLSHAASSMAVTAAENAMGEAGTFAFHLIPRGIWTIPQVGSVGLSEEEAEKKGEPLFVSKLASVGCVPRTLFFRFQLPNSE